MSNYTGDHLIEQPAIQLMEHELGWDSVNAYDEWSLGASNLGREAKREVVLRGRLKAALQSLNPELPAGALDAAVEELTRDRSALSGVEANREIDKLLCGGQRTEVVRVIDWEILPRAVAGFPGTRRDLTEVAISIRYKIANFHQTVKNGEKVKKKGK